MKTADLYNELAQRHGHYCPMSTLGLRIGLEVVRLLADETAGWQFCYRARTCAADGISLALEQSTLSSELRIEQQGQHLLLCNASDGRELSLGLSEEALQLAAQYRELDDVEKPQHLERLRTVASEKLIDFAGNAC